MIRSTRRGVIAGALAVPTIAGLAGWRWQHGEKPVMLHDPQLESARRFAAAATNVQSTPIDGDRIRLARKVFAQRPSLVAGVSRHADLLLIADVAREAGYFTAATLLARDGMCTADQCRPGWNALARLGSTAGPGWAEALAQFAANPGGSIAGGSTGSWTGARDKGLVLGWIIAPRV